MLLTVLESSLHLTHCHFYYSIDKKQHCHHYWDVIDDVLFITLIMLIVIYTEFAQSWRQMLENAVKCHFCCVFAVKFEDLPYISSILKELRTFNRLSAMKGIWTSSSIRTEIFEKPKFCHLLFVHGCIIIFKNKLPFWGHSLVQNPFFFCYYYFIEIVTKFK